MESNYPLMLAKNSKTTCMEIKNIPTKPDDIDQMVALSKTVLEAVEEDVIEEGEAGTTEEEERGGSEVELEEAMADFLLLLGMSVGLVPLEKTHTNISNRETIHQLQGDIQWVTKKDDPFRQW